jgi:hypothetical protein
MFNTIVGPGAVGARAGAGATWRYGSGSDQKMRLLAAPPPAPQHWFNLNFSPKSFFVTDRLQQEQLLHKRISKYLFCL